MHIVYMLCVVATALLALLASTLVLASTYSGATSGGVYSSSCAGFYILHTLPQWATLSTALVLAAVASILLYSVMLWHTPAPPLTSTHTHALFKLQCGGNWCVTQSAPAAGSKVLFPRGGSHFRHTRESSSWWLWSTSVSSFSSLSFWRWGLWWSLSWWLRITQEMVKCRRLTFNSWWMFLPIKDNMSERCDIWNWKSFQRLSVQAVQILWIIFIFL